MTKQIEGQMSLFDLGIWCGKTCPEPSLQTKEKISGASSKKLQGSSAKMPLFLDLQRESGLLAAAFWATDGVWLGELQIINFGEHPNVDVESRLSQILEDKPHPKYSLSAKACQGILNRAHRRGKTLPKQLEEALIAQSASKNAPDVRGGARESSYNKDGQEPCQPKTTNQSCNWDGTQIAPTLTSHNANGAQRMPDKENFTCVIQDAYDKLTEGEVSASIKASGGNYGGAAKL